MLIKPVCSNQHENAAVLNMVIEVAEPKKTTATLSLTKSTNSLLNVKTLTKP